MLKLRVIAIGDHKDSWVANGCAHFEKLLSKFAAIDMQTISSPRNSAALSSDEIRKMEAALLLKAVRKGMTVCLADSGKEVDSMAFAKLLQRWQTTSGGTISFLIGGPHGLHRSMLDQADAILSLSKLTFSHQVVRLVLLEQLYRGFTILAGTGYHK